MSKIYATTISVLLTFAFAQAQTNTFPATGNVGIGTLAPVAPLQVVGASRFGSAANYLQVDASGNLSFTGTPGYKVAGNKYAFQYSGNPNYGLFFNSTSVQYEFRNGSAVPVFLVNANTVNSIFNGSVKIGAYTLPAIDGAGGQVLKTNGAGVLTWSADNNTSYIAGTGISIAGNIITNSTPDKTVVLTAGSNISITGTYPNFTISNTVPAGWTLTGNSGTNPSTQFIGTTDAKALAFKVNNIRAAFIEADELKGTTAFGQYTLLSNTGIQNTAVGYKSLNSNSTGFDNVSIGSSALRSNTTGNDNTATGFQSLNSNTTGSFNTAQGSLALSFNTTGTGNAGVGYASLFSNTTGSSNTAVGSQALYSNSTGYSNIAVGFKSLFSNTTGFNNVSTGESSMYNNTTGGDNTATGYQSLNSNTAGSFNAAYGSLALSFNTTGSGNTAMGYGSFFNNTTGSNNTANGTQTLYGNTSGYSNVAVGVKALYSNTVGHNLVAVGDSALYNQGNDISGNYGNTAVGSKALFANTTGNANTSVGAFALSSNTTGYSNTATGYNSLLSNTTGYGNTANGISALYANTTGNSNTGIGLGALSSNTTGYTNTAIGVSALSSNTGGHSNVAVGIRALYKNANASNSVAIGDSALYNNDNFGNTAIGSKALFSNYSGLGNTAIGLDALYSISSGNFNTAIGFQALFSNASSTNWNTATGAFTLNANTTGSFNTSTGSYSLQNNTTGSCNTTNGYNAGSFNDNNSYCTFIGYEANQTVATDFTNSMALGNQSTISASNQVRIGNSSVTSIGGQVGWSTLSDGRFKKEVKENVPGLQFINKLKPVTYHLDVEAIAGKLREDRNDDKTASDKQKNEGKAIIKNSRKEKEKMLYTGFIAQDVEKAAKEIGYNFSGVDAPKNEDDLYSLRYAEFVVPLVKAVQELAIENDALKTKLEKVETLLAQFTSQAVTEAGINNTKVTLSAARLEQNIPNPFSNKSVVKYYLPDNITQAVLKITGTKGETIKSISLNVKGNGSISFSNEGLAAGVYYYSLFIDGKMVDTKKMVIAY